MRLSDTFRGEGKNDLQLNLTVYNINEGRNQAIMKHCRTLREYSRFVAKMRRRISSAKGPLTEKELEELLKDLAREDGYEEGREDGHREIARNLKGKGMSPEDIAEVTGLTTEEIKAL